MPAKPVVGRKIGEQKKLRLRLFVVVRQLFKQKWLCDNHLVRQVHHELNVPRGSSLSIDISRVYELGYLVPIHKVINRQNNPLSTGLEQLCENCCLVVPALVEHNNVPMAQPIPVTVWYLLGGHLYKFASLPVKKELQWVLTTPEVRSRLIRDQQNSLIS